MARSAPWLAVLALLGAAIGLTDLPYAFLNVPGWLLCSAAAVAILPSAIIARGARTPRVPAFGAAWIVPLTLLAVLATQAISATWWPNSGDEYGYSFLAQTLLHGRFYNPPPPVRDLFGFNWIFERDGKWFSQYPPGFSLLLVPFLAAGVPFLLNPVLTAALAWMTLAAMRALGVDRINAAALTVLLVFSPFVLFNGAALFPHMLCAVAIMAIIWWQASDEAAPSFWRRCGIGAAFGILLLTRYEVFAIMAALFCCERLLVRRASWLRDIPPMLLGGAPAVAFFLVYNTAITNRPWRTPFSWVSPGGGFGFGAKGDQGINTAFAAAARLLQWTGELTAYTSAVLVVLVLLALITKLRQRQLRYFDLIFPVTVAFFFFFASAGGHRFGPRYWFFAWPPAMLTLATALADAPGWLRVHRWRLHLPTLAWLHLAVYAGTSVVVGTYFAQYVAIRRAVYAVVPPSQPAIVLIPTRLLRLSVWQTSPTRAGSADFSRNGVEFDKPVLYGRADDGIDNAALYVRRACALPGRRVYRWDDRRLSPVVCETKSK